MVQPGWFATSLRNTLWRPYKSRLPELGNLALENRFSMNILYKWNQPKYLKRYSTFQLHWSSEKSWDAPSNWSSMGSYQQTMNRPGFPSPSGWSSSSTDTPHKGAPNICLIGPAWWWFLDCLRMEVWGPRNPSKVGTCQYPSSKKVYRLLANPISFYDPVWQQFCQKFPAVFPVSLSQTIPRFGTQISIIYSTWFFVQSKVYLHVFFAWQPPVDEFVGGQVMFQCLKARLNSSPASHVVDGRLSCMWATHPGCSNTTWPDGQSPWMTLNWCAAESPSFDKKWWGTGPMNWLVNGLILQMLVEG